MTTSNLVEFLGLLAVVVGVALFDWRAAVVVGGLVLVLVGWALDSAAAVQPSLGEREVR